MQSSQLRSGYFFGLHRAAIESAGIDLETVSDVGDMAVLKAREAPVPWGDAESYTLIFYRDRLLKLNAVGKRFSGDLTGSEGKAAYRELIDELKEKYGNKPSPSFHSVGHRLWDKPAEFYQCLAYTGCGLWVDDWSTPEKNIAVQLNGVAAGTGYVDITYESAPEWAQALQEVKSKKQAITKKGL